MKTISVILVVVGFGMMGLARYKIRCICEKYPIEVQLTNDVCAKYGPWPQRKENTR